MVRVQYFQESNLWIHPNFLKIYFLKTLFAVTVFDNKHIFSKSGTKKDVAVSVNKASMNKVALKKYFSGFKGVFRIWSNIYNEAFL